MNIRHTLNFAPDGSASRGKNLFAAVAAAASGKVSTMSETGSEMHRRRATDPEQHSHNHDGYDDGLVHSHGWATSEY